MICFAVLAAVAPTRAFADEPPTADQLAAAKKAYADGKALHDAGKLLDAVDKFKESYRLSKNALLLYNIGLTLDEAGQKDSALLYYRQFLADAPPSASQRATASERVKALEKEKLEADLNATSKPDKTTKPDKPQSRPDKTYKPAGTYGPSDFQHNIVEDAPPGKPLDVTASVPEDSGFVVTLNFRASGDAAFTTKRMQWRYKELVGRIPAAKMSGSSIQYYLEVKDQAGTVITRSGKASSPNLINLDPSAKERFYPDFTDEGTTESAQVRHEDEDPLHPSQHTDEPTPTPSEPHDQPSGPGDGFTDVGSDKFKYTKWGTTAGAATLLAASILTYVLAGQQASDLVNDSKSCGTPPCREFDHQYDAAWQSTGKRYQTISNVTFGVGLAATAVAGYFWYRELTAKKHGELRVGAKQSPESTLVIGPSIGGGFAGAAAGVRF
ncbi:MAG TPA: hypothetical protein VLX92_01765 [Kofleriaceae bacterium]|nr:hypothetical protein [Kofleriaceae bacterium]